MNEEHSLEEPSRSFSYEKPKLQRYGDVAELTRAIGNKGNADAGIPPQHKTSLT